MTKNKRIILLTMLLVILGIIFGIDSIIREQKDKIIIVIFTSLFMLAFTSLLVEHFFTKPADVLASSVSILLLIAPLKSILSEMGWLYYLVFYYSLFQFLLAVISLILLDGTKAEEHWKNKTSYYTKLICSHFGNSRVLYFSLFVTTILTYIDSQNIMFAILFCYAIFIILINPSKLTFKINKKQKTNAGISSLGSVVGVHSNNIFLVKLFKDYKKFEFLDSVFFKYKEGKRIKEEYGIVLDKYYLNDEQWARILVDDNKLCEKIDNTKIVYNTKTIPINHVVLLKDNTLSIRKDICGVIVENSTISKIRFYYKSNIIISEGTLLEVFCNDKKIMYQVIEGNTNIIALEKNNNSSCIIGEAIQLGEWDDNEKTFIKFGWVPNMNTLVYIAKNLDKVHALSGYTNIGNIPNTNYPIFLHLRDTINHHLAILGVTGCGKSVFTRDLIRKIAFDGTKVICIDFTNEYKEKLADRKLKKIVCDSGNNLMAINLQILLEEKNKYANQRDINKIKKAENSIRDTFGCCLKSFLTGDEEIGIFELPDLSNTDETIEYTKWFFKVLFMIAKNRNNYDQRVCVVLEEAHTIVPEWNTMGTSDNTSRSLVNSIAQIALQGRKYNIGFIVIAQRTANVSKTVLTQCNSLIAFKEFDNTSKEFISNYIGNDLANSLGNLKSRQAIAVGKSFKSNIPLIFEVPEINEK
ncbi:hypothetical protein EDC19_0431 [Natranaerovirga hydrolytica]|uniref:Helicase HerA central domain-containing protein n=1 Tax=Natranaerovirga hydrolytica TaxID=680378 RepID=A0A4R1N5X2_9FIRM|nr:DUF87 domain-containing protein [Natranaerovirga hydrolytica]TCK98023.1 hypothetical protein EDC19_0431 [Natranaerovirga hydrolytica]